MSSGVLAFVGASSGFPFKRWALVDAAIADRLPVDLQRHRPALADPAAAVRELHPHLMLARWDRLRPLGVVALDETCDVGNEYGSPVTTDYAQRKFTGGVNWVEIDLGLDDHDHLIKPEDRLNVAMAIQ